MGRYHQQQSKKRKPAGLFAVLLVLLFILAGAAGLYFYNDGMVGMPKTESLPLPLPPGETSGTDPLSETFPPRIEPDAMPEESHDDAQEQAPVLPELHASDGFIRDEALKVAPLLSPWVQTDQLARKFLLIVNDFSQGETMEEHMRFLKPAQPFVAGQDQDGMYMAESDYRRYDALAAAIDAIDAEAASTLYKKIRPLLMSVYAEFSYPDGYRLEDIFLKAGAEILAAPVINGRIGLVRASVLYEFADPKLEALNPVQKQMLRLGPANTAIVQNKVRQFVEVLSETGE